MTEPRPAWHSATAPLACHQLLMTPATATPCRLTCPLTITFLLAWGLRQESRGLEAVRSHGDRFQTQWICAGKHPTPDGLKNQLGSSHARPHLPLRRQLHLAALTPRQVGHNAEPKVEVVGDAHHVCTSK